MTIDASLVSQLSMSGVYTLILFVSKETTVTIGRTGKAEVPKGILQLRWLRVRQGNRP